MCRGCGGCALASPRPTPRSLSLPLPRPMYYTPSAQSFIAHGPLFALRLSIALCICSYYQEQELRAKFSVDHDALKAYFPLKEVVLPSILRVYETLMHIAFVQQPAGAVKAWHEEAILYHVYDRRHAAGAGAGAGGAAASSGAGAAGEAGHGRLLGYLYLDLHPREGKYNHAAVFPLVSGCDAGTPRADGSGEGRVLPVCAMVCNFPKAMGDKPALLPHGDAVTLGHELGHVLHHLLSNTKTKRFSSFAVEGDYVEAPSVSQESHMQRERGAEG